MRHSMQIVTFCINVPSEWMSVTLPCEIVKTRSSYNNIKHLHKTFDILCVLKITHIFFLQFAIIYEELKITDTRETYVTNLL